MKYADQYNAYQHLVEYGSTMFNKEGEGALIANQATTLITRFRQVTSYPAGIIVKEKDLDTGEMRIVFECDIHQSQKLDVIFDDIVELVQNGSRVVVFSTFTAPIEELSRKFNETIATDEPIRSALYYGKTSEANREVIKADFDARNFENGETPKYDVALCQYKSAGEGLNFTDATETILIDREASSEKENQAKHRTNRMGQKNTTRVHIYEMEDTIDEVWSSMVEDKKGMVQTFEEDASAVRELMKRVLDRAYRRKVTKAT